MVTRINGEEQIQSGTITRGDLNTTLTGAAVITKVNPGIGISQQHTGTDIGTGDVTVNLNIVPGMGVIDEYTTTYPGSISCSLRLLSVSYTGPCLNLLRDSDNTSIDIGFVNGIVDIRSAMEFCGTANGFVATWYDQDNAASAGNLTQTTIAYMPQFVKAGVVISKNGIPGFYFGNTNTTFFNIPNIIATSSGCDINIVTSMDVVNSSNSGLIYLPTSAANTSFPSITLPANTETLRFNSISAGMPTLGTIFSLHYQFAQSGTTCQLAAYYNGILAAQTSNYSAPTTMTETPRLGEGLNSGYWNGNIYEVHLVSNTNLTTADFTKLAVNQNNYYATSFAGILPNQVMVSAHDLNLVQLGWSSWNPTTANIPLSNTYGVVLTVGSNGTAVPHLDSYTWIFQYAYSTGNIQYYRMNIDNSGWTSWAQNLSLSQAQGNFASYGTDLGSVDFNTAITSGFYRFDIPSANSPGISYGQLIVSRQSDTCLQLASDYANSTMYMRTARGILATAIWNPWVTILDRATADANFATINGSSSVNFSANNLTTDYITTSSQTVTGALQLNSTYDLAKVLLRVPGDANHALFYGVGYTIQWEPGTAYGLNSQVATSGTTNAGLIYICTTAGTSGTTAPTWLLTPGSLTTDGTVVWQPYNSYFNNQAVDGPVLVGYGGGVLGTWSGYGNPQHIALSWNSSNVVKTLHNTLDDGVGNLIVTSSVDTPYLNVGGLEFQGNQININGTEIAFNYAGTANAGFTFYGGYGGFGVIARINNTLANFEVPITTNGLLTSANALFYSGTTSIPVYAAGISGFAIGWNFVAGTGETDFINCKQGGPGGFNFYSTNLVSTALSSSALIASLSPISGLIIHGPLTATSGAFSSPVIVPNATATNEAVPLGQGDGRYAQLAIAQTFLKTQTATIQQVVYATTITLDLTQGNDVKITLTGNTILANPSAATPGSSGHIAITQDATGGRTMAYGSYWKFGNIGTPSLSTAAKAVDTLVYWVLDATHIVATLIQGVQ